MSALITKHLESIGASMALLNAQLEALKHELAVTAAPAARETRPARPALCADVPDQRCALVNDEARIGRASMANPHAWQCVGCKLESVSS